MEITFVPKTVPAVAEPATFRKVLRFSTLSLQIEFRPFGEDNLFSGKLHKRACQEGDHGGEDRIISASATRPSEGRPSTIIIRPLLVTAKLPAARLTALRVFSRGTCPAELETYKCERPFF